MLSNEDVARRILIYSGQVHAAAGMSGWCFDHQKNLLVTTSSHEEELHSVLKASACLDYAFDHFRPSSRPFILSDTLGVGLARGVFQPGRRAGPAFPVRTDFPKLRIRQRS